MCLQDQRIADHADIRAQPDQLDGKVLSVGPKVTTVEIVSKSACASCHAAGLCTAFESVQKQVEVPTDPAAGFTPGEEVEVTLRGSLGTKAVLLAYVVPLFILLILVVSLSFTDMHAAQPMNRARTSTGRRENCLPWALQKTNTSIGNMNPGRKQTGRSSGN